MSQTTPISQWRPWTVFTFLTTTLGLGVIAAWVWLNQSLSWLPNPDSQEGKDLLYDYNRISHGLVFALLGLAVLVLLRNGLRPESEGSNADLSVKPKPWWKHLIVFAGEHRWCWCSGLDTRWRWWMAAGGFSLSWWAGTTR